MLVHSERKQKTENGNPHEPLNGSSGMFSIPRAREASEPGAVREKARIITDGFNAFLSFFFDSSGRARARSAE